MRSRIKRHKKQRGVSLLETVIALAIASYALIASYGAFSGGLSSLNQSVGRSEMMVYAETILADIEMEGFAIGQTAGVGDNGLSWVSDIELYTEEKISNGDDIAVELSENNLVRIEISISDHRGDKIVLETLRLRANSE